MGVLLKLFFLIAVASRANQYFPQFLTWNRRPDYFNSMPHLPRGSCLRIILGLKVIVCAAFSNVSEMRINCHTLSLNNQQ